MINSVFYCDYSEFANAHRRVFFFSSEFEHLISHRMHVRTGLYNTDYLLEPFSQIFASSRQNEAILCNRIKRKCFGLYFQGKAMFINNKEEVVVKRREKK